MLNTLSNYPALGRARKPGFKPAFKPRLEPGLGPGLKPVLNLGWNLGGAVKAGKSSTSKNLPVGS